MVDSHRRTASAARFVGRHFLVLLFASYLAAALWPGPGLAIRVVSMGRVGLGPIHTEVSLPLMMLACLLFNAGLGVDISRLGAFLRRPRPLAAGLAANILFPLLFILGLSCCLRIVLGSHDVQSILAGLALVASMPIAGSSTAWSQNADGDMTLSLGLVLGSTFLSPLVTPLGIHLVGFLTTGAYSRDLHRLASGNTESFLAVGVLVPSLLGIAAGRLLGPMRVAAVKPDLKLINALILIALNYSNAAISLPKAIAHPDIEFLGVILVIVSGLCALAFVVGWGLATLLGTSREQKIALMFALGMNNNGTGLVLASMAMANHPRAMLPIIFYNMVQHLVAGAAYSLVGRGTNPPRRGHPPAETSSCVEIANRSAMSPVIACDNGAVIWWHRRKGCDRAFDGASPRTVPDGVYRRHSSRDRGGLAPAGC
ncbi:MAG: bile acid:sodium symporter family protein [Isosphaeraceae bacterium]